MTAAAVNRRRFLRQLGGAGLLLAGSPLLGSLAGAAKPSPDLGKITYQLSFLKNFQFAGEYFADYRKYYQKFGLQVDLVAGGPALKGDAVVAAGVALVGQSSPDITANAVKQGAPLKIIGANYQKCVNCIISLAQTPIKTPRDLIGKKIGLQITNLVIWRAFLKLNKIDPASVPTVTVGYDISPLTTGEVDGFFSYANGDLVTIKSRGYDVCTLLFADYGYDLFTATYSVLADSLADKRKRAQLVAFMKGEIRGWQDAIDDPAEAGRLTSEIYGKGNGLDVKLEEASCRATNDFMVSADTKAHGLFWMSPDAVQKAIATLAAGGVHATPDLFTNEILEEAGLDKS
jgi:ABC-type nitrate/sulfonate/bicarbonate transport system substrate-binding protein